jgi:general secretion pathway protein G
MSLSSKVRAFTLIEMLVSIVIIAILASVAMPYAETIVKRQKEVELKRAFREMRTALDEFHQDWRDGLLPMDNSVASEYGYPKHIKLLVEGVQLTDGQLKRYLRRIPRNPFASQERAVEEQWLWRGYEDSLDTRFWNGRDVYDVRTLHEGNALDGSYYHEW